MFSAKGSLVFDYSGENMACTKILNICRKLKTLSKPELNFFDRAGTVRDKWGEGRGIAGIVERLA
jgi:hypothetical protein